MNKKELAELISARYPEVSAYKVEQIISHLVDAITEAVKTYVPIKISGLGTFSLKEVKSRPGSNPQTREKITIPAYRTVKFKASTTLKKAIKE